jgi:hypothetical protein
MTRFKAIIGRLYIHPGTVLGLNGPRTSRDESAIKP